jgi:hypothetical protein
MRVFTTEFFFNHEGHEGVQRVFTTKVKEERDRGICAGNELQRLSARMDFFKVAEVFASLFDQGFYHGVFLKPLKPPRKKDFAPFRLCEIF